MSNPVVENQDRIWDFFQNEGAASFAGARARLAFLARRLTRGQRVLDVGVGDGAFVAYGVSQGLEMYALDPSERSIESLRRQHGLGERAQVGYGQAMPFADETFDAVVMSEVLEHLGTPILEGTLREVVRVLRPGGRLIGTVPAREQLASQTVVCPDCGSQFHRWGHQQSFDEARMRAVLGAVLTPEVVESRLFAQWDALNWKGKLQWAAKRALLTLGVHGDNEKLFFVARRPPA